VARTGPELLPVGTLEVYINQIWVAVQAPSSRALPRLPWSARRTWYQGPERQQPAMSSPQRWWMTRWTRPMWIRIWRHGRNSTEDSKRTCQGKHIPDDLQHSVKFHPTINNTVNENVVFPKVLVRHILLPEERMWRKFSIPSPYPWKADRRDSCCKDDHVTHWSHLLSAWVKKGASKSEYSARVHTARKLHKYRQLLGRQWTKVHSYPFPNVTFLLRSSGLQYNTSIPPWSEAITFHTLKSQPTFGWKQIFSSCLYLISQRPGSSKYSCSRHHLRGKKSFPSVAPGSVHRQ